MKIAEKTWELAAPVAERLGLTLWDVKYVKEGASFYLRIFIDKEGACLSTTVRTCRGK